MQFNRRNINKILRNGDIVASSLISSYSSSSGSGGGGTLSGNYLPATIDENSIYVVPHYVKFQETTYSTDTEGNEIETVKNLLEITKDGIKVNGNIFATGEVAAYRSGTTTGGTSNGSVTIYDGLDSTSVDVALSANQGRILKELYDSFDVDSISTTLVDLTDTSINSPQNGQILFYDGTSSKWINKTFNLESSAVTQHIADTVKHITEEERTKWNNKLDKSIWDSAFYFDDKNNLRVKVNVVGEQEISAYGAGTSTSSGAITIVDNLTSTLADAALSANQGRVLKDLIDSANLGDFDLSDYSKTSHTHNYAESVHTHPISAVTNLQESLDAKSGTGHSHNNYSTTSHTHNYTSKVKVGSTEYTVSANTISLPSYPTLSSLSGVSVSTFNTHTGNTSHITSTERTNWNKVYNDWNDVFTIDANGNLKVKVNLIGEKEVSAYGSGSSTSTGAITIVDNLNSTLVDAALSANQGRVLKDMIDSANLGDFDLSGYSKTSHTHSNYSTTGHTHTAYSPTGHTHTIANITNLQSTLDGKSGTGHTHSAYSPTSHTHSNYSVTSHTHNYAAASHTHTYSQITDVGTYVYDATLSRTKNTILAAPNGSDGKATFRSLVTADIPTLAISKISGLQTALDGKSGTGHTHSAYSPTGHTHTIANITNLQSSLDGKSGTGHSHSNYSVTSHTHSAYYDSSISRTANTVLAAPNGSNGSATFRSLVAADIPTLAISKISNLQSTLDGKSGTGHSHSNYSVTSHTHNYAGSSSAGGAATSANKVNSTLTFTGGTFATKTFNGSAATTVNIPTHTSHITNNSGFITTAATVANANYATSAGSATNATTASKLSTVSKTAWGQTFWTSGGIPASISGNMTGVGSISASGNITTSAEVTAHSDRRLKSNIQPLDNRGYVQPYTYDKDGKQSIGFIAQDMQNLYPELVSVDESTEEKYLSINYMQYTAVLQQQIIDLKKEIDELKDIIKDIKK